MGKPLSEMSDEELMAVHQEEVGLNELSDDDLLALHQKEVGTQEPSVGSTIGKYAAEYAPMAGAAIGGVLGTPLAPPYGTFAGAGLGAAAGKTIANMIEKSQGVPKTREQLYLDPIKAIPGGMAAEAGGQLAAKGISKGLEYGGKFLYESGLPTLGQKAKDVLWSLKATGNKSQLGEALQGVINEHMAIVDNIAAQASQKGAKVSMLNAMQPALKYAKEIEINKTQELYPLAKAIRAKAAKYIAEDARAGFSNITSKIETGSLPIQGEMTPGFSSIGYKKGEIALPVQGQYAPGYSKLGSSQVKSVSLPVGGQYSPAYSQLGSAEVKNISLPVQGEYTGVYGNLGEKVGERFLEKQPVLGRYTEPIPGKTYPEQFVSREPVIGKYNEPIPGQTYPEEFVPKEPVIGKYTDIVPGKTYPEQLVQKPEIPWKSVETIPGETFPDIAGYSPSEALLTKRTFAEGIPESSWQLGGPSWHKGQKLLYGGTKTAIEDAIEQSLGSEARANFMQSNINAGELIEGGKALNAGYQNASKPLFNSTDAGVAAISPFKALPIMATKRSVEKYALPIGATMGKAAGRIAQSPQMVAAPVAASTYGLVQNIVDQGTNMAFQALQMGMPSFMIDLKVKDEASLKPTESSQIRNNLRKGTK